VRNSAWDHPGCTLRSSLKDRLRPGQKLPTAWRSTWTSTAMAIGWSSPTPRPIASGPHHGDWLVLADAPPDSEWTTDGVRACRDANGDVGGPTAMIPDGPHASRDGYEDCVFDSGYGIGPDEAWIRRDPGSKILPGSTTTITSRRLKPVHPLQRAANTL